MNYTVLDKIDPKLYGLRTLSSIFHNTPLAAWSLLLQYTSISRKGQVFSQIFFMEVTPEQIVSAYCSSLQHSLGEGTGTPY